MFIVQFAVFNYSPNLDMENLTEQLKQHNNINNDKKDKKKIKPLSTIMS